MSEIQKYPNLIRGGGGQQFSKMSEIQKSLKFPMGGGVVIKLKYSIQTKKIWIRITVRVIV